MYNNLCVFCEFFFLNSLFVFCLFSVRIKSLLVSNCRVRHSTQFCNRHTEKKDSKSPCQSPFNWLSTCAIAPSIENQYKCRNLKNFDVMEKHSAPFDEDTANAV